MHFLGLDQVEIDVGAEAGAVRRPDEAIAVDLAPTLAQVTGKALTAVKKWATKSKGASSAAKNPPKALPRTAAALERTGNDAAKG